MIKNMLKINKGYVTLSELNTSQEGNNGEQKY